ncbi:MAG TPA: hypothetical protein DHD79_04295 [Firmicutes bacterium]|jgi:hypothetical protein|nr:hypothetical protein [Bacillota bacterium]HAW71739.1 hypothetical protein [Bacillota bacterium]HAZ21715.1 hypothetical protein [Bacillota bacterium]HBE06644.1 hypothetical protein [Bacillota bacterium]HBG45157.1 hypothetical protein [Bacillota bacterium]
MNRKLVWVGFIAGIIMVCLTVTPALANSTNQLGSWSLSADYHFTIAEWGWDLDLNCNYEGWLWVTAVDKGDATWFGHIGVAETDNWNWDNVGTEADVDLYNFGAGVRHRIVGPLAFGIEADLHALKGVDAVAFQLYSGNLMVGPIISKDVDMLLGTWTLKAHAMVGPGLQMASATHHDTHTFCGVAVDMGAELGYLLFDTLGVSASINQKYEMSPWGEGSSNLYSSDQLAYVFSGVLRF